MPELAHVPGYPKLRRFAQSKHGRAELVDAQETPDGQLVGYAKIPLAGGGFSYQDVNLGRAAAYK